MKAVKAEDGTSQNDDADDDASTSQAVLVPPMPAPRHVVVAALPTPPSKQVRVVRFARCEQG